MRARLIMHVDDLTPAQQGLLQLRTRDALLAQGRAAECEVVFEDDRAYLYPEDLYGLGSWATFQRGLEAVSASLSGDHRLARLSEMPAEGQEFVRKFLREQRFSAHLSGDLPSDFPVRLDSRYRIALRSGDRVIPEVFVEAPHAFRSPPEDFFEALPPQGDRDEAPEEGTRLHARRSLPLRFSFGETSWNAGTRMRLVNRLTQILEERLERADEEFQLLLAAHAASLMGRDVPAKGRAVADLDKDDREAIFADVSTNFARHGFASREAAETFVQSAVVDSSTPMLYLSLGMLDERGVRHVRRFHIFRQSYP
jgi:hypothetical protein